MNAELQAFLEKAGYKKHETRSVQVYHTREPDTDYIARQELAFNDPDASDPDAISPSSIVKTLVVVEDYDDAIYLLTPAAWDSSHNATPVGFEDGELDIEGVFAAIHTTYGGPDSSD